MNQWGIKLVFLTFLIGKMKSSVRIFVTRCAKTIEADLGLTQLPEGRFRIKPLCVAQVKEDKMLTNQRQVW